MATKSLELRCSGLPITTACVASIVPPAVRIDRDLYEARLGTATHEIMAAVVEPAGDFVVNLDAALDVVPAYADMHRVQVEDLRVLVVSAFRCWEQLRDRFPQPSAETYMVEPLPCHSCLDPAVCWCGAPWAKLTGHADVMSLSDDGEEVLVGDFKTGHGDADPVQLQGYGWLGLQRHPTATRVRACLIRVRDQSADWHTWTRDELDTWAKNLRESLSRTEVFRPGTHCGFCSRGHECPAKTALLQQAATWLPGVPSMTIPTDERAKGALLATALQQVKQLETACEKAREMIRAEVVAAGGTLTADDGMELAIVHQERRSITATPESSLILESFIPEPARWGCIEFRKTKVEEAVRSAAPPRKGAAMIREMYDRLEGVGAIATTTVERLELRRSLPTITHDSKESQP